MKRSKPLAKMTFDELHAPELRRAVLLRGRYVRRLRSGLSVDHPLPGFSLEDAVDEIMSLERDRVRGDFPKRRNAARGGAALRQRKHRLRKLAPAGVAADVWAEIVEHFKGACHVGGCTSMASRVGRLEDGTPVPACVAHSVQGVVA